MSNKLREDVISQIRVSKICKAKLQIALDKAAPTIQRYLDDNDILLTTDIALETISSELNLPKDNLIDKN